MEAEEGFHCLKDCALEQDVVQSCEDAKSKEYTESSIEKELKGDEALELTETPYPETLIAQGDHTPSLMDAVTKHTEAQGVVPHEDSGVLDFDDVFGSAPAWMDIPEEYLNVSATPCLKESSSDFSFDIDAILSSVRSNKSTVEIESGRGTADHVGVALDTPLNTEIIEEHEGQCNTGTNFDSSIQTHHHGNDDSMCKLSSIASTDSLNINNGRVPGCDDVIVADQSNSSCIELPVNKEPAPPTTIIKRVRKSTFNKEDECVTNIEEPLPDCEGDTPRSSTSGEAGPVADPGPRPLVQATPPSPTSSVSIVNSSIASDASSISLSKETSREKRKAIPKPSITNTTRSLKRPGQSLLPSKASCLPLSSSSHQSKPATTNIKRPITGKTTGGITRQTSSKVKRPTTSDRKTTSSIPTGTCKRDIPTTTKRTGVPKKTQPIRPAPPSKDTAKPAKTGLNLKPVGVVKKPSSLLPKPKSALPSVKPFIRNPTKPTAAPLPSKQDTLTSIPTRRRRSIATSTPTKLVTSIFPQTTPDGKDGTFVKDGNPNCSIISEAKKKRRSFIPTPLRKQDVSPIKPRITPIPLNIEDEGTGMLKGKRQPPYNTRTGLVPPSTKSQLQPPNAGTRDKGASPNSTVEYDPEFELQLLKQQKAKLSAKVVHSPIDKENRRQSTPRSKWSPIKRKKVAVISGDECFQCTKYTTIKD